MLHIYVHTKYDHFHGKILQVQNKGGENGTVWMMKKLICVYFTYRTV